MRTLKLTLEYDGTNYAGWQIQKNGVTIQQLVQDALCRMTRERVKLSGASRTDAGVHALAQVASFRTKSSIPCEGFLMGLLSLLPKDIVIKQVEEVESSFRVIQDAKRKEYRYLILNDRVPSPLLFNRAWHIRRPLNIAVMKRGAKYLLGQHDFSSFMAAGSSIKTRVRTVEAISITVPKTIPWRLIHISVVGNGFLRHQVRNMVGTLIQVGEGKRWPEEIKAILKGRNRKLAGPCAPAHGLYLVRIDYI